MAAEPRWLDAGEIHAWRSYIETVLDLQRRLESDLVPFDLTIGDYQVLVHLSERDDRMLGMRELASLLQLTPSGLTRRIDGLVRSGDVERIGDADDRRVTRARLTDQGFARLRAAAPVHVESVRRWFLEPIGRDSKAVARAFLNIRKTLHPDRPVDRLY